ncbi:unnamed protein product [Sphagnum balticum]
MPTARHRPTNPLYTGAKCVRCGRALLNRQNGVRARVRTRVAGNRQYEGDTLTQFPDVSMSSTMPTTLRASTRRHAARLAVRRLHMLAGVIGAGRGRHVMRALSQKHTRTVSAGSHERWYRQPHTRTPQ